MRAKSHTYYSSSTNENNDIYVYCYQCHDYCTILYLDMHNLLHQQGMQSQLGEEYHYILLPHPPHQQDTVHHLLLFSDGLCVQLSKNFKKMT